VTELAFHFNVPDRLGYACRLLRKAVGSGARVVVTGPPDTLQELDALLWTFSATDFVPHCLADSEPHVVAASPVILSTVVASAAHQQVLLNLGELVPSGFDQFERVIELVGQDERERQFARARWKQYTERGHAITRHDLTLKTLDQ
jgi:DNA polymerase-3 subunit chi